MPIKTAKFHQETKAYCEEKRKRKLRERERESEISVNMLKQSAFRSIETLVKFKWMKKNEKKEKWNFLIKNEEKIKEKVCK